MTLQKQLERAIEQAQKNSALFHQIVQGGEESVQTEAGPLKPLPALLREIEETSQQRVEALMEEMRTIQKQLEKVVTGDETVIVSLGGHPQKSLRAFLKEFHTKAEKTSSFLKKQMEERTSLLKETLDTVHSLHERILRSHEETKDLLGRAQKMVGGVKASSQDATACPLQDKMVGEEGIQVRLLRKGQEEMLSLKLDPHIPALLNFLLVQNPL